ncbi:E3 ubiquitin-protein ligase At1g12760-like isoform X1 [Vicia villosa]|uniref:E3 ubiquitin-protein ligase At1g12760-like isoform X1 n=1 Tax=Vicia villosa TaxID=3911 RepID=UPI00273BA864|nr:E3 ubiquitin-protein ligase At1g12760-like isoform X1 [Vicia villosa]
MATTTADPTPLIGSSSDESNSGRRILRTPSLRQAARFLRQASGRRLMREPSMMVRETAAEQLEERQSDWAYSKPVVILDILWNLAFIIVAATVMILSRDENPSTPLRLWILGYALQCVLHTVCVCFEYRRRVRMREQADTNGGGSAVGSGGSGDLGFGSMDGSGHYVNVSQYGDDGSTSSWPKHLESANTMFSFIWWVIGFYWVSADGHDLINDSPMLYWLCIVFLGFDVFFVVFCIALACIIGLAVCCCLPCIIALLYAVADQEGATKEDIEQLSKFKFQRKSKDKLAGNTQGPVGGIMTECRADSPIEHVLADEDAECCICLSAYDDGVELRQLPCGHHFHCGCVDKWLHINATCPLCKYDILKSSTYGREEV